MSLDCEKLIDAARRAAVNAYARSSGVKIGAAAYAVYYVARVRIVCRRLSNPFSLFTLVAWLGFEGYSLMDTGTFVPFPTMALVLVTAGVLEIANSRPQFKGEPDEYNRTFARGGAKAAARRYAAFTAEYTRKSASAAA